jgi:4-diphosphocytidyl-2-C-methyl-D-erythritol kinase
VALPTARVFAGLAGEFSNPARFSRAPRDARELAEILALRRNDLLDAAARCVPQIRDVLQALEASPACLLARMSGSGATCFGLYADSAAASHAATWLAADGRGWWIAPSTIGA